MTRLKADEIVSNMLSKHEVDPVPELKIEDPKVMKDVDIAGGEGDVGSDIKSDGIGNTNIAIDQFSASDVPSVRNGEFNEFFNSLSVDELDTLWANPEIRDVIEARLRS